MELIELNDREFKNIASLVYRNFGIYLTEKKKTLVRGRLNSVLRKKGYESFQEYYESLLSDQTGKALIVLVDRISTNHSFFFREREHFDSITDRVLPALLDGMNNLGREKIRLWCAGCAAGEEAYSLAIVLKEYFKKNGLADPARILATDISLEILEKAVKGCYPLEKLTEVEPYIKNRYFNQSEEGEYCVDSGLKQMVLFKRLNLMDHEFPFKKKFHVIFCRNVMIYFDQSTKTALINKFRHYLRKGGYLFVGHAESLGDDIKGFGSFESAVYRALP